jgi:hypothetical protein
LHVGHILGREELPKSEMEVAVIITNRLMLTLFVDLFSVWTWAVLIRSYILPPSSGPEISI